MMESPPTVVRAVATALPRGRFSSARAAALMGEVLSKNPRDASRIVAAAELSEIRFRHSVLAEANGDPGEAEFPFYMDRVRRGDAEPTTAERMEVYARESPRLAEEAARRALDAAGLDLAAVTHLVTVTCTGFFSPGLDFRLIEGLKLRGDVARAQVGFMGCHAALNACGVARGFARSRPDAQVLVVCVELCTLHFQAAADRDALMPNLLFADGAAALVVSGTDGGNGAPLELVDTASTLFPNSADAMTWRITDKGFRMTLDKSVPDRIASGVRGCVDGFLARHELSIGEVSGWAIHPGGPRILSSCLTSLGLPASAGESSMSVLRERGNMSSPTVLFILRDLLDRGVRGPIVGLAFGPGLVAELALFRAG